MMHDFDDEVDNGSVDTGEQLVNEEGNFDLDYDPKTINRLIRTLLNIFDKFFNSFTSVVRVFLALLIILFLFILMLKNIYIMPAI